MEEIKRYIEENKQRFLDELFELIRIPSISSEPEHKADMYRCAEQWTKLMLAALSISSMHIRTTRALLLVTTP